MRGELGDISFRNCFDDCINYIIITGIVFGMIYEHIETNLNKIDF